MVTTINSVREVAEQNMASTEQMKATSGEVDSAIADVASIAQENSAAVQQVSAAAQETSAQAEQVSAAKVALGEMAENLSQRVGQFKLNGNGAAKSGAGAGERPARQAVAAGADQNGGSAEEDGTPATPPNERLN